MVSRAALPLIDPAIPTLIHRPFHRHGWVYEEKVDGWRMVAYKDGRQVRLVSRHGRDHGHRFPELAAAIARLPAPTLILDGEVARFDEQLVSRFYLLSDAPDDVVATPPVFMAFDCLWARGQDLRRVPLAERRQRLEREIGGQEHVLPVRRLASDGLKAWAEVTRRGLEGLVAKDEASLYLRSATWLKVKVQHEGVFAVGGIIDAHGFAGLYVGQWVGADLHWRGTVEYGFRGAALVQLLTLSRPLVRETSPFIDLDGHGGVIWLDPKLEVEVAYTEVMQGRLRDPVFRQLVRR